jgi:hypothetical protein
MGLRHQLSPGNAEHYAVDQFNIHQAPGGYLIVNQAKLGELIRLGMKKVRSRGSLGSLFFYGVENWSQS